jgi:hypothetical protein
MESKRLLVLDISLKEALHIGGVLINKRSMIGINAKYYCASHLA